MYKIEELRPQKWSSIISAIILFYYTSPYFVWGEMLNNNYIKTFLIYILGILFFKHRERFDKGKMALLFIWWLIALVVYCFTGRYNINLWIFSLPILLFPFLKNDFRNSVFDYFLLIYASVIALSLVFWFLAIGGIIAPYKTIAALNELKNLNYYVYPFLVTDSLPVLRFFGVYDEPGVVGTLSGILLCINKFNSKDWKSIILLSSGLLSLSFFFYLLIPVYYMLYFAFQKKSMKKIVGLSVLLVLIVPLIHFVPVLNEKIGERLVWDSTKGSFAGDNRINQEVVDFYYMSMLNSGSLWTGIDNKEDYLMAVQGSSSFWSILIVNGLLFVLLYIGFFTYYGYIYMNRHNYWLFVLYLFVFLGVIYQRPSVFNYPICFLFICLARAYANVKYCKSILPSASPLS